MSLEEASTAPAPARDSAVKVLTAPVLQEALLKDVGPGAKLTSFKVKDFCSKGDNFACYVTSVAVRYVIDGDEKCVSYVAKLNQFQQQEAESFVTKIFEKEGRFHCELVPALNKIRKSLSLSPLKYPPCFYSSFDLGHELLLLEDMRSRSFRMANAGVDLDADHVQLVMKQLAHLHATSVILEQQMGTEKFLETFNFFDEMFTSDAMAPAFKDTFLGYVQNGIKASAKVDGYEKVSGRLQAMSPNCLEQLDASTRTCDPKFRVVNHGDCWKNNMLFRYDGDKVADVCLLDLQITRHGSLGIELNHFFFTSVDSETRKRNMKSFLSIYYNEFKTVFETANEPMKFTLDELYNEYRLKNTYGALIAFMGLSILGLKTEDMPDFSEIKDENIAENIDKNQMKVTAAVESNPIMRSRIEGLLKEIDEHNIF